ncbi:uncharacterized protein LOC123541024 [Mercenaria mercenaria]|uniref:uncharacterized protein LOC123541024 n=1 Tax=Mercenaria mercenaria TaxID=6596 RepID=UPI00234F4FE7|nr:uncharacterized protein LOC123541024 [Mercenaria mercenaria]
MAYIYFQVVIMLVYIANNADLCFGTRKTFNHEIHVTDNNIGRFKLNSHGRFSDIIHLDDEMGIKRLLCRHDKILIAFKENVAIPTWRPGQIVLGGSEWACALSKEAGGHHEGIYARIRDVFRPKPDRLDLVIGHVGPFDLLEEASIHFHFDPTLPNKSISSKTRRNARKKKPNGKGKTVFHERKLERTKRGTSNMLTDILNRIDWHKNVSMFVPFNYDARNHKESFQFSLKRMNGSKEMHVSTGAMGIKDLLKVPDYFSLDCLSCFSVASLKYTFDLKIEKVDNKPVLKQYISQVETKTQMHTDFALRFREEMTINGSRLFWKTQPKELLRIPLAVVPGLPPVELLLSYDMDIFADIHAAVSGPSVLRNRYTTKGSYVMSQTMTSQTPIWGDVSVSNWTVVPSESHSMLPSFADVKTSFKHRMGFNASLIWSGKDVSISLSPQTDITLEPDVSNIVHSDYFGKCHSSDVVVVGNFSIQDAYFHVQAFGKEIWNKYLASGYEKHMSMTSGALVHECKARCVGPSMTGYPADMEDVLGTSSLNLDRNHSLFSKHFRGLRGNFMIFSMANNNVSSDGVESCDDYTGNVSTLCSARLVTLTMATKLARLQRLAQTEWQDRHLVVVEGLDESPHFRHNMTSPYRDGRAMTLALTNVNSSTTHTSFTLSNNLNKFRRLGQLAVCSGFDYVAIKNQTGQLVIEVGVKNETSETVISVLSNLIDQRRIFDRAIQSAGSRNIDCQARVLYKVGDSYPFGRTIESWCGPPTGRLHFLNPDVNQSLYEYPFNDISFKPEGQQTDWCGSALRTCNSCNHSSSDGHALTWDSCITRIMSPRLALRLRKLANIARRNSIDLQVEKALVVETNDTGNHISNPLFLEGRAARITLTSSNIPSKMNLLMNAALCAGFDYVSYTSSDFVDVFVRRQDGYLESKTYFPNGRGLLSVQAPHNLTLEYGYPLELANEARQPSLFDGHDDKISVSKYYTISDFKDKSRRDFRLDAALVECLEEVSEEAGRKVEIVPGSGYIPRSKNMKNLDTKHPEEKVRHRSGQAARINFGSSTNSNDLVKLGKSLIRKCQPLLQQQQRCIGIGCHVDSLYIDVRPVMAGNETTLIHVWNSGGGAVYTELQKASDTVNKGGPLIAPIHRSSACSIASMVSADKPYLSFQFGHPPQCTKTGSGVSEFCKTTRPYLLEQASKLQDRLTSAAGSDRLPKRDIIDEINACVVDACGGCPGTGPMWDQKVRVCSKMIEKYLSRASSPFREMTNKTSFFNPDNPQSTVHSLACHDGNICVENTQLYSLLMPLITATYRVNSENSVEERLFNNEDNPSPLLELVGQELAMHT